MYWREAANDSGGVFHELAPNGSLGSSQNVLFCWATQFVTGSRTEKCGRAGSRFRHSGFAPALQACVPQQNPMPNCINRRWIQMAHATSVDTVDPSFRFADVT
jgi:hypothetical protein